MKHKHDWLIYQTKSIAYTTTPITGSFTGVTTTAFCVRSADEDGLVYDYTDVSKYICGTCKKVWEVK